MKTPALIAAGVLTAALAGANPAYAGPHVDPPEAAVPVGRTCPTTVIPMARQLRALGFTAQAAKNYALLTREDCLVPPAAK